MRVGQWGTVFVAGAATLFALVVHVLTYLNTPYFLLPQKSAAQPIFAAMLVVFGFVTLSRYVYTPAPWYVPRLIGPPHRVNYMVGAAGVVGVGAAIVVLLIGAQSILHDPAPENGWGSRRVAASGRRFLSDEEYSRRKIEIDRKMGDLFYRAVSAGMACIMAGTVGYGLWYIARQPAARVPDEARSCFDMGQHDGLR